MAQARFTKPQAHDVRPLPQDGQRAVRQERIPAAPPTATEGGIMRKRISYRVTGLLLGTAVGGFRRWAGCVRGTARDRARPEAQGPERRRRGSVAESVSRPRRGRRIRGSAAGSDGDGHRPGVLRAPACATGGGPGFPVDRPCNLYRRRAESFGGDIHVSGIAHSAGLPVPAASWHPSSPLVATPIPALLAGTGTGRALGASVAGLLLGGVAYIGGMVVTEAFSNVNLLVATAASSVVHAGVMSAILHEG